MENAALENEINSTAGPMGSEYEAGAEPAQPEQKKENFIRMVTFALGGKDYAIDILKVKEIAKAAKFTYVPNAPHFVRGVYNLRGLIISIIDLRKFFNLTVKEKKEGEAENILILRVKDTILGVIVDNINKVANINADNITPPPPLFQEANLKYMSGVMEYQNNLHIILDIEKMFGEKERGSVLGKKMQQVVTVQADERIEAGPAVQGKEENVDITFIVETLGTFKNFHYSALNRDWVEKRFIEWQQIRNQQGLSIQLSGEEDAAAFLETFYSPSSGQFWSEDYVEDLKNILPDFSSNTLKIWNPGCGKGYETYSLACLLREKFPKTQLKIWAIDNYLLYVTAAATLMLRETEVMRRYVDQGFVKKTESGYQFTNKITDSIIFEYHDLLHKNSYPEVDLIIARDTLSFFKPQEQQLLLDEFRDNLKEEGILIVGRHERLDDATWGLLADGNILAYRKKKG